MDRHANERGPGVASFALVLVIVLAAGALAYGALHDGSKAQGFGQRTTAPRPAAP